MADKNSDEIQEILDSDMDISAKIDGLLALGLSKKKIMSLDFKESTVRARIKKFKEEGKEVAGSPAFEGSAMPVVLRGTETLIPESMVRDIEQYFDGSAEQRRIFSAGMMVPLMGVRLFAEMVKPLTMLINAMKGDQVTAMMEAMQLGNQQSHNAAMEAAEMTATRVGALMSENEATRAKAQVDAAMVGAKDPGKAFAFKTMQPMMENMMTMLTNRLMPGLGGGQAGAAPAGWTKKQE